MQATHIEEPLKSPQGVQRPQWLPSRIPELDGLRGLAVLGVVIFHSTPRLVGTPFHDAALWGWTGVNLFFVLSGFLITSILLGSRAKPQYFRNFYGRRILRIWPVYALALAVCYLKPGWFVNPEANAPWWVYVLFVQNLFHITLPYALGPTWSLAIEEQYYYLWAPSVRFLRHPWLMAVVLVSALVVSPLVRLHHYAWITPTHTLSHLDGIAMGSMIALGLHTLKLDRRAWLMLGCFGIALGFSSATDRLAGGTAFLDSALAVGFGGAVLAAIASTGARSPLNWLLRSGPLAFYGKISYGLYIVHIFVFIYFGWFDLKMDAYGTAGNMAVVAMRLAVSTALSAALWYGFESRILRLKRFF